MTSRLHHSLQATRLLAACLLFGGTIALAADPAGAAKPNNQACLGEDIRAYAAGRQDFGVFVSALASSTNGVGDQIQAHLAGDVPDEVLHNSCND